MPQREVDLAAAAMRRMLSGRAVVRVLAAMSPQQPDRLIALLLETALEMRVKVVVMFADLEGRLAFLDETMRPHVERGDITLVALAGAVPRRWGASIDFYPDSLWNIDRMIARGEIAVDLVLAVVWRRVDGVGHDYGAMIGYTDAALSTHALAAFEVRDPTLSGLRYAAKIAPERAEFLYDLPAPLPAAATSRRQPSAREEQVAERIAALVPPHATVQLGIGGVGNAIAARLAEMPGIGLHSGILPASLRAAVCAGKIDGAAKSVEAGLAVATGIIGHDEAGADWCGKVELQPISQTHAPERLRAHHGMWAINSALEVDLSGQVNAEFAGDSLGIRRIASGGGQADFVRGARLAGGASVIALTARTRDGRARIVNALPAGTPPTAQAQDIDFVVTEFGVATLRGRSMVERRAAMIAIAHPEDRAMLAVSGAGEERLLCNT